MKKLASLLLSALMILSLAACGVDAKKDQTAYELYESATEKLNNAKSMSSDVDMEIAMTAMDETMKISTTGKLQQVMISDTEFEMAMDLHQESDLLDESNDFSSYYKDGTMYMDMDIMKFKMDMPMDEYMEQAAGSNTDILEFPETAISEYDIEELEDDARKLSFTLIGSELNAILDEMLDGSMSQFFESMGADLEEVNYDFNDVSIAMVIDKDDNIKTYTMLYGFAMDIDDETIDVAVDMSMDILGIDDVVIDFPEDLDTYVDMSDAFGGLLDDEQGEGSIELDEETLSLEDQAALDTAIEDAIMADIESNGTDEADSTAE